MKPGERKVRNCPRCNGHGTLTILSAEEGSRESTCPRCHGVKEDATYLFK